MMNIGNPESAFEQSFIPNDGVGLAREEFIINSHIKIHPKALIEFDKLKDKKVIKQIEEITIGYKDKKGFVVYIWSPEAAKLFIHKKRYC